MASYKDDEFNLALTKAYEKGDIDEFMRLLDSTVEEEKPKSEKSEPVQKDSSEGQSCSFADYCAPKRPGNRNSRKKRGNGARRANGSNRQDPGPSRLHANAAEFVPSSSHRNLTSATKDIPNIIDSLQKLEMKEVQQIVSALAPQVQPEAAATGLNIEGMMIHNEAMNGSTLASQVQPQAAATGLNVEGMMVYNEAMNESTLASQVQTEAAATGLNVEGMMVYNEAMNESTLASQRQAEAAAAGLDAEGAMMYTEAMNQFDSAFPTLGGNPTPAPIVQTHVPTQSVPQAPSSLVEKMRLDSLKENFGWVNISVIENAFVAANGSLSGAEAILNMHFPKPQGWDAMIEANRPKPVRRLTGESSGNSSPNRGAVRHMKDVGGHWVTTGAAVGELYATLRAKASVEARTRNAFFDRAKAALDRGERHEAWRLGALGREANVRMKKLHDQAADSIYEARNSAGYHGQIDLHGLHVTEATDRLADALECATGNSLLVLTGSGHHTKGTGKARLKPAVESWLKRNGYYYEEVADSNAHVGAFMVRP